MKAYEAIRLLNADEAMRMKGLRRERLTKAEIKTLTAAIMECIGNDEAQKAAGVYLQWCDCLTEKQSDKLNRLVLEALEGKENNNV